MSYRRTYKGVNIANSTALLQKNNPLSGVRVDQSLLDHLIEVFPPTLMYDPSLSDSQISRDMAFRAGQAAVIDYLRLHLGNK